MIEEYPTDSEDPSPYVAIYMARRPSGGGPQGAATNG